MKAPETTTKFDYELAPKGTHLARIYKIVYLGTQKVEWQGVVKDIPKLRIFWELPNEPKTWTDKDGKEQKGVFSISKEYSLSMGMKSNLRPIVDGILGVAFTDAEAYAFDLDDILGKECLINISHKKSKDGLKEYAIVETATELMKGQTCPPLVNQSLIINPRTLAEADLEDLPSYLKDKIKESPEWQNRLTPEDKEKLQALKGTGSVSDDEISPEDIPF